MIIQAIDLQLQFSEHPIFRALNFTINKGDRIAILGRNGAGKSTLLKVLQGQISTDSGRLITSPGLRIATMQQSVPTDLCGTVLDFVSTALNDHHETYKAEKVISQLGLVASWSMDYLSGGQIRRALLARALVTEPDVLLLDEPTNHLDLSSIQWLEQFLKRIEQTVIFISHDRTFMQNVATRIFELDIGEIITWDGSYQGFLKHKENQLASQAKFEANFDKKLAQEEAWIRQGIKARRTRNEGRVRALKQMREARRERQSRQGQLSIQQQETLYASKMIMEIEQLTVRFEDKPLIQDFSSLLLRGDKVGIIGPNGSGKSSLIRCLLAEAKPLSGQIKTARELKVAYFDQHRASLDPNLSALDNVAEGRERIEVNGKSQHIISYLQDFLFSPERARAPISALSGGETNRLLLAKILSHPSQLLILDEPTNDLDMETLELLEDYLVNYPGTLLLVSHDRSLLNHVVTSTWVFDGQGHLNEYVGGYDDYLRQASPNQPAKKTSNTKNTSKTSLASPQKKKLGYLAQRELDALPAKIEKLEQDIAALQQQLASPSFYQQEKALVNQVQKQLKTLENDLEQAYTRWQELEDQ
jgi:ATP-binding cassette subfamily F protein uup